MEPALIHGITCMRDFSFFRCAVGSANRISHTNDQSKRNRIVQWVAISIGIRADTSPTSGQTDCHTWQDDAKYMSRLSVVRLHTLCAE